MSQTTRPTPTRRQVLCGAAALAVGLLSACSDDGGDAAATDTTPTTGTTPSSDAAETAPSAAPSSSSPPSPAEAVSQTVTATEGEMYIELSRDSFSPGTCTIEVVNEGDMTHDLVVERDGQDVAATPSIPPGGTATLEVVLEAGDYVFYCSIGRHRAMGMETSVTVSA